MRQLVLTAVLALLASTAAAAPAVFAPDGVAIRGYDPVAYFTESEPVKGSVVHTADWNGARWKFATAANRALFIADPKKMRAAIWWLLRLRHRERPSGAYPACGLGGGRRQAVPELRRARSQPLETGRARLQGRGRRRVRPTAEWSGRRGMKVLFRLSERRTVDQPAVGDRLL